MWFFGSVRLFTVNKPIANTLVSDGTAAGIQRCQAALAGRGGTLCDQGVDPQHQYSYSRANRTVDGQQVSRQNSAIIDSVRWVR